MKIKRNLFTRAFAIILSIAIMFSTISTQLAVAMSATQTPTLGDDGYYQLKTVDDLYWFATEVNKGGNNLKLKAKLMNNLTVTDKILKADGTLNKPTARTWTPMGKDNKNKYVGTFDGQGFTISGLLFNDTKKSYIGLFGYNSGTIKNIGIVDSYFNGKDYVGGVVGFNYGGTITNCYNKGSINGTNSVGGVAGYNSTSNGTITNCYNTGLINNTGNNVGGVAGCNDGGTVINCYNTGLINNTGNNVGGVAGCNDGGTVTNCYNIGSVTGKSYVAGVVGKISGSNAQITNCYTIDTAQDSNATSKTEAEFKSGEVCYLLNGEKSQAINVNFFQTINIDNFPVLDNTRKIVYKDGDSYTNLRPLTQPTKGDGSQDSPYELTNENDLYWFARQVNSGDYSINAKLMNNIKVNENVLDSNGVLDESKKDKLEKWTPIGSERSYKGTFDGNNCTISGLYFNDNDKDKNRNIGLFSMADSSAIIKNVGIVDSYFNANQNVGAVAGYNLGLISGSYNTGFIKCKNQYCGGVVGENKGKVENCYNTGLVTGYLDVGGVAGENYKGTITNCYNTASIMGQSYVGGVVPKNYEGTVTNCYNTGSVTAYNDTIGGVVGENTRGTITNCYNTASVASLDAKSTDVGGVVGSFNYGTIENCYYKEQTGLTDSKATSKTDAQFKNGEVAYLLNGDQTSINFYQSIGSNDFPVLDNTHGTVYKDGDSYTNSKPDVPPTKDIDGYYQLKTVDDLYWFAKEVNKGGDNLKLCAKLMNDITVNSNVLNADGSLDESKKDTFEKWTPIGISSAQYSGTFDGQGYTISGLYFNDTTTNYVGLFGYNIGTVKNVGVVDSYFNGQNYIGGVVGYNGNGGILTNCYNKSSINGYSAIGGVVGYNGNGGILTNCYNTGSVNGYNSVGGVVCFNNGGTVTNCYNTGSVRGNNTVGGVVCFNNGGKVENCYNTGSVNVSVIRSALSATNVGGVVGYNDCKVTNCYNTGSVTVAIKVKSSKPINVGGVVGESSGDIINSYNTGLVNVNNYPNTERNIGGIVGQNDSGTITNCYYKAQNGLTNSNATSKTEAEFSSGEVAYLLNGSTSEGDTVNFYQTINSDNSPVLDNTHKTVYYDGNSYTNSAPLTQPANGDGSEQNPYELTNENDLYWFANEVNSGKTSICAKLMNDITVNSNVLKADGTLNGTPSKVWTPIGNSNNNYYTGTFDGQGHTISGLYFDDAGADNVGLFGCNNGTIKNVGVVDSYLSGHYSVGGVVGNNNICGTVTNCYNTGSVKGIIDVGGVVGYNLCGTVTNCYNTGSVKGSTNVGGVVGLNRGKVTNCYNTGSINGNNKVGDVVGENNDGGTSTNCYYKAQNGLTDSNATSKTEEQFKNGEVAYLLNGSTSTGDTVNFYQTINSDNSPVLDKTHKTVYYDGNSYTNSAPLTQPANGNGSENSPYEITNEGELYWFANEVNSGKTSICAKLMNDIKVNSGVLKADGTLDESKKDTFEKWTPIGNENNKYSGTFDGQGHTISGLYFNDTSISYVGLFGLNKGTVKNIGLVESYFNGQDSVGGVAGSNIGKMTNCYNTGSVTGKDKVGGVAGYNIGIVTNCYNTGSVTGNNNVGGGVGYNFATIDNCYNTGSVTGGDSVGGVAGFNARSNDTIIINSYNTGSVKSTIIVGGVVGKNCATVEKCYNTGSVTGDDEVGGIVGFNAVDDSQIKNCYNTGLFSGTGDVGGVVGKNSGTITNCYNTGLYVGIQFIGGVAGSNNGTITNCYYKQQTNVTDNDAVQKTDAQFKSGEVAYLLNGEKSTGDTVIFYQTINSDNYPVFDNTHKTVYYDGNSYTNSVPLIQPTKGDGSQNSPYELTNESELYWFANEVNKGGDNLKLCAKVIANITVNSGVLKADGTLDTSKKDSFNVWTPIGKDYNNQYGGTFDGQGFTISGLYFNDTVEENVGLFGCNNGTIKNVGVVDSYFNGYGTVGGIVGYNIKTVTNCYNTGSVNGNAFVGGVVGYNVKTVTNCYNTGSVNGDNTIGGVVGSNDDTVTNCYNTGSVNAPGDKVGGVVGEDDGTVTNCYYLGRSETDSLDGTTYKTEEQFKSGEVAYLLNGSTSTGDTVIFYQTIGSDNSPVLDGKHNKVYFDGNEYTNTKPLTKPTNGEGTEQNPYQIANENDLYWFANEVNSGKTSICAKVIANITVNSGVLKVDGTLDESKKDKFEKWTPIGNALSQYSGTFDGQGHTISGLYFNDTKVGYVGLFGCCNGSTIRNVGVVDSYFNCDYTVGGVVGYNSSSTIENCYNTGSVNGIDTVGGVVGRNYGSITNCYNTGLISCNRDVGGVTSINGYGGTVTNCYYKEQKGLTDSNATSKTEAQFKSGEVAYLLNGSTSTGDTVIFYQTIGSDNSPVLDSTHKTVYFDGNEYTNTKPLTKPTNGDGSQDRPYELTNENDLYWFAKEVNGGNTSICAKVMNDITVNDKAWTPIGNVVSNMYAGTFDGQGYTISGLYLDDTTKSYVGLFGCNNGTVKNIGLVDSYFNGKNYVGGVVGYGISKSEVTNCYNTGSVNAVNGFVGGVVGYNDGKVTNCYNTGSVSGDSNVGGVVASNGGTVENCYNTGSVTGDNYVGGVVAINSGKVTNCYNTGSVTGSRSVGGVVSYNNGGKVTNCYNTGSVTGRTYVGGVVGENEGTSTITNCYYLADNETDNFDGTTAKNSAQFASGEVAYLLNGEKSTGDTVNFYQTISSDTIPVLDSTHKIVYKGDGLDGIEYVNTKPFTKPTNGDGTEQNPYQITNENDLYWFARQVNYVNTSICAKVMNDITVKDKAWTPIGNVVNNMYAGTFDGNNCTISGLYLDDTTKSYVGLFGCNNGTVKNVGVVDSYFNGKNYVGGVVGANSSQVTNCYNKGSVNAVNGFVGGVVGYNDGKVTNCYNKGSVNGNNANCVGGVSGVNSSTVENCYNTGSVRGNNAVGGVSGSNGGTVTNCYNTGSVTGNDSVGGVSGVNSSTVENCYNTGSVTGNNNVAGVVGYDVNGTITNCYYLGTSETDNIYGTTFKTDADFSGGAVAYLLNGDQANINFYQTIGTDDIPVLDNTHKVVYKGDGLDGIEYTNTKPFTKPTNGDGSQDRPYELTNENDLYWFARQINYGNTSICAKVMNDITVNSGVLMPDGSLNGIPSKVWTPIGNDNNMYAGTFDGQGYTISGLYFDDTTKSYVGLFGCNIGTITNIGVADSYFNGSECFGGVASYNEGTVTNCYNKGSVKGKNNNVGGVVGFNVGTIENCYNTGLIQSSGYASGGVVGYNSNGTVTNCYNTGSVNGNNNVGGVVGQNGRSAAKITNCYNTGSVNGHNNVGGIVGSNNSGTVTNCYNTGLVTGNSDVGGVVGYNNSGTIANCYNTGSVTGNSDVGGVVGEDEDEGTSTITNCYYLADSETDSFDGTISKNSDQFASGEVAYLLNSKDGEPAFFQTIKTDSFPVLDNTHNRVYINLDGKYVNEIQTSVKLDYRYSSTLTVFENATTNALPTPTWGDNDNKDNYTFSGWYTGIDGTGIEVTSRNIKYNCGIVLYAKWVKNSKIVMTTTLKLSDNANSFDNSITTGVKWDKDTKTLTLTNATFNCLGSDSIIDLSSVTGNATIKLVGDNTLVREENSDSFDSIIGENLSIIGADKQNDKLTIVTNNNVADKSIYTVYATDFTSKNCGIDIKVSSTGNVYGMYISNNVTIEDSNINIDVNSTKNVFGIFVQRGSLSSKNSTFNINAKSVNNTAYGINAFSIGSSKLEMNDCNVNITVEGSTTTYSLYGRNIVINKTSLELNATSTESEAYGISSTTTSLTECTTNIKVNAKENTQGIRGGQEISVNKGSLTVNATSTDKKSYGICASGTTTLSECTTNITANGKADNTYGIYCGNNLTVINQTLDITSISTATEYRAYGIYAKGTTSIDNCTTKITANGYNTAVGIYSDKDITVTNGSLDIKATSTQNDSYGLETSGKISITDCPTTITISSKSNAYGIDCSGDLAIENGSLNIEASSTDDMCMGIMGLGSVSINNCPTIITVNGNNMVGGIVSNNDLTITGQKLDITATSTQNISSGINSNSAVSIDNCTTTITANGKSDTFGIYSEGATSLTNCPTIITVNGIADTFGISSRGALELTNCPTNITVNSNGTTFGLYGYNNVTINNGSLNIETTSTESVSYGVSGVGSVSINNCPTTITVQGKTTVIGIDTNKDLTITGQKLDIKATSTEEQSFGIYSFGAVSIGSCTTTITAKGQSNTYGIKGVGALKLINCPTTITANSNGDTFGIHSDNSVTVTDNTFNITSTSTQNDSTGILRIGEITLTNCDTTITANAQQTARGIEGYGSMVANKGTLDIKATSKDSLCSGITNTGAISITDCDTTINANGKGNTNGIFCYVDLSISNSSLKVESSSTNAECTGIQSLSTTITKSPTNISVNGNTKVAGINTNNDLTITGQKLDITATSTDSNCDCGGISAIGSVTLDNCTTTITINGQRNTYGIYANGEILLNNCPTTITMNSKGGTYGIYCYSSVTVTGNTLDIKATSTENDTTGILGAGAITIENCTTTITANGNGETYGIYCMNDSATVTGSTLNITSTSTNGQGYGISAKNDLTANNSTINIDIKGEVADENVGSSSGIKASNVYIKGKSKVTINCTSNNIYGIIILEELSHGYALYETPQYAINVDDSELTVNCKYNAMTHIQVENVDGEYVETYQTPVINVNGLIVYTGQDKDSANKVSAYNNENYLRVFTQPNFTINAQPTFNSDLTVGSIAGTMSVDAQVDSDVTLNYQWYKVVDGKDTAIDGATSKDFTIPTDLTAGDYGFYCLLNNDYKTDTVNVKVEKPVIKVDKQPTFDGKLTVGSINGTISVNPTINTNDELKYQWYKVVDGKDTAIDGATSKDLTIPTDLVPNDYGFYCVISSKYSDDFKTNTVDVKVEKAIITITQQPTFNGNSTVGSISGTTSVGATVNSTMVLTYQWYKIVDGKDTAIDGATSKDFTIPTDLTAGDYSFHCVVSGEYCDDVKTDNVDIKVVKPVIKVDKQPTFDGKLTVGSINGTISVNPTINTNDELKYQWYQVVDGKDTAIDGATSKDFTIPTDLVPNDYGFYCIISSKYSDDFKTNTVDVKVEKAIITIIQQPTFNGNSTVGSISGTTSVGATVNSTMVLTYQWYQVVGGKDTAIDGATSKDFTIPTDLTAGDYSFYCVVSGKYCDDVKTDNVDIKVVKPIVTIDKQPTFDDKLTVGSINGTISVNPTINTNDELKYQWYQVVDGKDTAINGATSKDFTIPTDLLPGEYGFYCIISSKYSDDFKTDIIKVSVAKPIVTIDKQPTFDGDLTVGSINGTITVNPTIDTDVKLTYQWHKIFDGKDTAIDGATSKDFTIPTDLAPGEYGFYCVISNEFGEDVKTDIIKVSVAKPVVTIVSQPNGSTVDGTLSADVTVNTDVQLKYQWYMVVDGKVTAIDGATSKDFKIPTDLAPGEYGFYCVISNEFGEDVITATATITVKKPTTGNNGSNNSEEPNTGNNSIATMITFLLLASGVALITIGKKSRKISK